MSSGSPSTSSMLAPTPRWLDGVVSTIRTRRPSSFNESASPLTTLFVPWPGTAEATMTTREAMLWPARPTARRRERNASRCSSVRLGDMQSALLGIMPTQRRPVSAGTLTSVRKPLSVRSSNRTNATPANMDPSRHMPKMEIRLGPEGSETGSALMRESPGTDVI